MAGKGVFRMAARSPRLFRRLSRFQGWLAAHAPRVLFRMLFATATGLDRDLARDDIRSLLHVLVDVVVQLRRVDGRFRMTEVWYDPLRKRALVA